MTTALIKKLPLAAVLLATASGCSFLELPDSTLIADAIDGSTRNASKPLLPFQPGNTWAYIVTNPDGSQWAKWIVIDHKPIRVGGNGVHQNDLAFAVRTKANTVDGPDAVITMQATEGDKVVNYREELMDSRTGEHVLDQSFDPHQLEIDQSAERTRPGVSWMESYTEFTQPNGRPPTTVLQQQPWTVVGHETLTLPAFKDPIQTVVFQKGASTTTMVTRPSDAGGIGTSQGFAQTDGGGPPPKTLWYARGIGRVKEAGGGQPTEELTYYEIRF